MRSGLMIGFLAVGLALGGCAWLAVVPPAIPTGVGASDGTVLDRIVIVWESVRGASRYEVWRATSEDGPYVLIDETTETTYSDTDITVNTMYWYKIKACNRVGCSDFSTADSGYVLGVGIAPVPAGVLATDGTFTDRVRVTWNLSPGATTYQVWRDVAEGGPYALRGTVSGTTFDDMDVVHGRVYWYKVMACNASDCSVFSVANSGFTFPTVPDPATNVAASAGTYTDRVRITWTAAAGAATYEVHRSDAEGGPYTLRATVTGTNHVDTGVTPGPTYWYRVLACNAAGCSAPSVSDSGFAQVGGGGGGGMPALPGQPRNVAATDGARHDRIHVTWSSVSGATRYEIWWSTSGNEGTFTQLAETTTTTYDDTAPAMCAIRWYRVLACNASGCGPGSVPDSGYRGGTLEQVRWAATPVTITYAGTGQTVSLTWTTVANALLFNVRYEIWRRSPGVAYALLYTTGVGALSYADANVVLGTTYHYRIRACSTHDCILPGAFSSEVQAVVACNPAAPASVTATRVAPNVTLEWPTVTGAAKYQLYRSTASGGPFTYVKDVLQGDGATTTATDTPGLGTFFYAVKTCVACGCGGLSAPSNGVTVTLP